MAFPSTKTGAINNVTIIDASHINSLEDKVGIDNSTDTSSLDYKLAHIYESVSEIQLTPKVSSSGPEGTMFYDSGDNHVWVATE